MVEECLRVLASNHRTSFLGELVHWLAMAARTGYVEAGEPPQTAAETLRCCNEVALVVAGQLRASLKGDDAYPDVDFMQVLREKSAGKLCEPQVYWALTRALDQCKADSAHTAEHQAQPPVVDP